MSTGRRRVRLPFVGTDATSGTESSATGSPQICTQAAADKTLICYAGRMWSRTRLVLVVCLLVVVAIWFAVNHPDLMPIGVASH